MKPMVGVGSAPLVEHWNGADRDAKSSVFIFIIWLLE